MKPLVSVITVCLNAGTFIEQAIQSVLAQTYPKIEYIIIDGGSTDGTVDIIRKYESRLAYWHSRPDRGLAQAFNLGLAQAQGDWLVYLNADDFFLNSEVVGDMAPYLRRYRDAEVVYGDVLVMAPHSGAEPLPLLRNHSRPWNWHKMRCSGMFNTIPHQAAFTHRRYFERVGPFSEDFRIAVDYEHYLRGGKFLRVRYAPLAVSGMRAGGLVGRNILWTFREFRRAQQRTRALPAPLAWACFYLMLGRYCLSRLGHRVLDPLAGGLHWPGRVSGTAAGLHSGRN
jgi:glycosyltransferase involved in cell wall biosynthesis